MGDIHQDQSMEEILASIKRVISEDGRAGIAASRGARARERAEPEAEPEDNDPEDDVLELSDPVSDEDGLLSQDSAAASRQSLAALAAMRQQNEQLGPRQVNEGPLEAVVREMLRPVLKDWLDQRLPEMVEDMVAREIARITGKGI
jgi:cell pole-organizing protein PopZ